MLLGLMVLISGIGFTFGLSGIALFVSGVSLLAYSSALFLCWIKYGTDILPMSSIRDEFPTSSKKYRFIAKSLFVELIHSG